MNEQEPDDFGQLHEDWVEKRRVVEELTSRYIPSESLEVGQTIELPKEVLPLEALEELTLAREAESAAWHSLTEYLRRPR